jgi:hypothetical protein
MEIKIEKRAQNPNNIPFERNPKIDNEKRPTKTTFIESHNPNSNPNSNPNNPGKTNTPPPPGGRLK